ncbi:TOTE conflict system archaeo-eukaryotic primase domain-containing protein [Rheinheimera riviphila]|uniref:TOTE conflict system archaeo-eukaryotic primase domain-containing protein n=1 Tax=Rheinheimera riviphila TaxID=1834037 RepID=UPI003B846C1B
MNSVMSKNQVGSQHFDNLADIDARLAEIEHEKSQLLARKEELLRPPPSYTSDAILTKDQKIAIFRDLFRGRQDIFANRWQNKQGRSGYAVACNNDKTAGEPFCTG